MLHLKITSMDKNEQILCCRHYWNLENDGYINAENDDTLSYDDALSFQKNVFREFWLFYLSLRQPSQIGEACILQIW